MFGFGKKKTEEPEKTAFEESTSNNTKELKVSLLKKRQEIFTVELRKKTDMEIIAQVGLVIDVSGSMRPLFRDGTVQQIVERFFPVAKKFDDDGFLDMWVFSTSFNPLNLVSDINFDTYVDKEIIKRNPSSMWGGTNYAPVMNDVVKYYKKPKFPAYVIFITDGSNFDKLEAETIIKSSSNKPIFWQFIGIGGGAFTFLEKLDNLKGRFIDNASFMAIKDINVISDEELYKSMMNEFPEWLKNAKSHKII